ncbi:DUF4145 domain-containing protein [Bremerella cremea]|uniref:DUF4145 domain-containing protein n=1 Tax=Bremerella cremea TaxID=1031537 RepID=A0A368KMU2_9BACT|nr:DEAD/DEAH box helicase family protein [Bremerella cremea]RCS43978.1 DUF4145 domain-containing protein [Bremerella cremea]
MPSNFDFLLPDWSPLHEDAMQVEVNALTAPRTCAFYARRTMELAIKWMYAHDSYLHMPYQDNLSALIHEQTFKDTLAPGLFTQLKMIQSLGNMAVHSNAAVNAKDTLIVTRSLHLFLSWLAKAYTKAGSVPPFNADLLPRPEDATALADQNAEQLQALQGKLAAKDEAYLASLNKLAATEQEVAKLKAEIQKIKAENKKSIADEDYTEEATRDLFIDLMLREAGWNLEADNVLEYEVAGMPNKKGVGYVDYVLWGDNGLPLAVVEAKKSKVNPNVGQHQAELYADCLEAKFGQRPVIFYTSGYTTWLWDDTRYPPRQVQGFYTRDQLQLMINRRTSLTDVTQIKVNKAITDRYYQEEALRRIMQNFDDMSRKALVVMATGSGKTRVSISAVDMLLRANWVKRVLFLADRTALLKQAQNSFNDNLPNVSTVNLVKEKENDQNRVVFSTYPTMMNCIDDARKDGKKRFGVGHFDLIIIDEAHRSVYQKYGAIFEYFDALLLGLTATPKSEVDRNTYDLFELEDHVPTFAYELEQAVGDEYLVPPKAVSVPLKFLREGIKYDDLSDEEKQAYEEKFYDEDAGELPDQINSAALNKWLFNKDTVNKVLKHLMESGLKVEGGDRIGKSIIFAKNHKHAEFIVEQFDANYPKLAGKHCRLIDNQVSYAQSLIDDFYIPNKPPYIAVSVDMLDTGIDVPEVVNLVFFKMVRSKTKFWQMVGRGTRLCPDLFGPNMDKEFFYIFDYCQNLEFFGERPDGVEATVQESIKTKNFKRRLHIIEHLQEQAKADLPPELAALEDAYQGQLQDVVKRMDVNNFIVRPKREYVERYRDKESWKGLSKTDVVDIEANLAPLPYDDDDEEFARRFDLLVLNMELAILESDPKLTRYQERIRELASGLEEKKSIPVVSAQMELILEVQTDEFWEYVTLPQLEKVRKCLRDLIKFVDKKGGQENVFTNFEDDLGEGTEIDDLVQKDTNLKNYRLKVERFIRDHETHITIHKLKTNKPITEADIAALESILFSDEGPGSKEDYLETYGTDQPLGKLVRQIVGLDQNAAKEAFNEFLSSSTFTADQITFINQIVEHLVHNGMMEPKELFESPFSDLHGQGVIGMFQDDAKKVVSVLEAINGNAVVA